MTIPQVTMGASDLIQSVPQTLSAPLSKTARDKIERWERAAHIKNRATEIAVEAGLSSDDEQALDSAVANLTDRLQENDDGETQNTDQRRIEALLGWLSDRVAWPAHLAHDTDAAERQARILAEELTDQPLEAIARAIKTYPKHHRFWPSAVADLYVLVDAERSKLRQLRAKLRTMRAAAGSAGQARRRPGERIPEHEWDRAKAAAQAKPEPEHRSSSGGGSVAESTDE